MTNNTSFIRKVIYIAIIGVLLLPLSMISRPGTWTGEGDFQSGGQLAYMRDKHDLSQAKMSEIDPASESMKLASLGLRGVAVNMLWMQAMDHKKKENYDQLASTLQALTKIQPNFVKVWEYQAHNMAYNVSMEFDDYEYRYTWVKKGIEFLKQGIPYNKRDHRVPDNLGFFIGNKMGKSDEKTSFRRLFRKDRDFHNVMSDYIDPEDYDQRVYGPDSWLMAHEWYNFSRRMVEEQSCPQMRSDMLFYMYGPAQIRNQAMSLQEENRPDEVIQGIWEKADDVWREYGNHEITNTLGVTMKMEGLKSDNDKLRKLREDLDQLVRPGLRDDLIDELMSQANFTDEDKAIISMDPDELTQEQIQRGRTLRRMLDDLDKGIDNEIAEQVESEENRVEAKELAFQIQKIRNQIKTIYKDSGTVNYSYWRVRNEAEATDICLKARQALYDAEEMFRQSIYDDEYDFDFKTKTKSIIKRGAISLYLDAFEKWQEVFDNFDPELQDGILAKNIVRQIHNFEEMLNLTNREWPDNFPLQKFIDYRWSIGEDDGLLTSELLAEIKSGRATREGMKEEFMKEQEEESSESDSNTDAKDGEKAADTGNEVSTAPESDENSEQPNESEANQSTAEPEKEAKSTEAAEGEKSDGSAKTESENNTEAKKTSESGEPETSNDKPAKEEKNTEKSSKPAKESKEPTDESN